MSTSEAQATIILGDSRVLPAVPAGSVHLAVTSPPYWQIKDYGTAGQIGYGQTLHEYLQDLYRVWANCHQALAPGRRLCVNIGDQFARKTIYGRYRVIPLHAEIIAQCEMLGFDYLGSIIWQKRTTVETSGGAVVMGSYPYPPNGIVELDYEYILLFRKPGEIPTVPQSLRDSAKMTKEKWKELFSGHWHFGGVRQHGHEAMFPDELPRRLIRMFTFPGETVLDPFLGSGTTVSAALNLGRNAVGCEINPEYLPIIRSRLGYGEGPGLFDNLRVITPGTADVAGTAQDLPPYTPHITDARPIQGPGQETEAREPLHRVTRVLSGAALEIDGIREVHFIGVEIQQPEAAQSYLEKSIAGQHVYLRDANGTVVPTDLQPDSSPMDAYVYLKNHIFINAYLIRSGMATAGSQPHRLAAKFDKLHETGPER
jgi:DNA modification methylase